MRDANLLLKPIDSLLGEKFFVPSYQRGYRWNQRQVTELLDDIWEFRNASEKKSEFYCLQPIVVKSRKDGDWELVDGQQRLTTIFLILGAQKPLVSALKKEPFSLRYETRPSSEEFLQNVDTSRAEENIDYYHMCGAYDAINEWFEARDGSENLALLATLTNNDETGKNVKVIWYELPADDDPVAAFTRLNVGKIPLTSAELVRALFLRSRNFQSEEVVLQQLKIAQEWDAIEKALQSDEFWYFLQAEAGTNSNRIEFVFARIAESQGKLSRDPYATFHYFQERLQLSGDVESEWLNVKEYFMTLEEWFSDRILYHLIGFLINEGFSIQDLLDLGRQSVKGLFRERLRGLIYKHIVRSELPQDLQAIRLGISDLVNGLSYEQHSSRVRSVLLLFNIATLLNAEKSNLRFPFEYYKKDRWDIEHVHSVASYKPETTKQMRDWLAAFCDYIASSSASGPLGERAGELLQATTIDITDFDELYISVLHEYQDEGSDDSVDNGIGNLTLLDSNTNRSYRNAVFPVKRQRVLEIEENGMFVPLCTKNVFLKSYSKDIGRMLFWGKDDRDQYRNRIIDTLRRFFVPSGGSQ